ncbi:MAG: hypothetical protein Q7S87_03115 [Agitococcus sp.]|nr:hypothetical protein [Agitococcus sp.]MDO9177169.1 hypothetical protein [Agitococcus sp.]
MASEITKTKTNKRGVRYGIGQDPDTGAWGVWKLCQNYAGHRKGGVSSTWRYIEKDMTQEAAETLFARRSA